MKKILKRFLIIAVIIIIAANGIFYAIVPPFMDVWEEGRMFVFGKYGFIFAHGHWVDSYREKIVGHVTELGYEEFWTEELVDSLKKIGCDYIWVSMCHSGDYDFMSYDKIWGIKKLWPKEVSRPKSGKVIPLFYGWLWRYTDGKPEKIDTTIIAIPFKVNINVWPEMIELQNGGDLGIHLEDIADRVEANVSDIFFRLDSVTLDDKDLRYEVPKVYYEKWKGKKTKEITQEVERAVVHKKGKFWKRGKGFEFSVGIRPVVVF